MVPKDPGAPGIPSHPGLISSAREDTHGSPSSVMNGSGTAGVGALVPSFSNRMPCWAKRSSHDVMGPSPFSSES